MPLKWVHCAVVLPYHVGVQICPGNSVILTQYQKLSDVSARPKTSYNSTSNVMCFTTLEPLNYENA